MVRVVAFCLLVSIVDVSAADAQRRIPSALVERMHAPSARESAIAPPRGLHVKSCAWWNVIAYGGGGAIFGWFVGTIQPLASDTGPVYQRHRQNMMLAGALLGTTVGIVQAVRKDCITSRPPNEELNLTGGFRQQLARDARELHLIESAGRLTPAR